MLHIYKVIPHTCPDYKTPEHEYVLTCTVSETNWKCDCEIGTGLNWKHVTILPCMPFSIQYYLMLHSFQCLIFNQLQNKTLSLTTWRILSSYYCDVLLSSHYVNKIQTSFLFILWSQKHHRLFGFVLIIHLEDDFKQKLYWKLLCRQHITKWLKMHSI